MKENEVTKRKNHGSYHYRIESFYEGIWSTECECEDYHDAKQQLKCYQENLVFPVRIRRYIGE